jgi:hypothetical protein
MGLCNNEILPFAIEVIFYIYLNQIYYEFPKTIYNLE